MAEIELSPQGLVVHMTGADRLWALKSRLEIPLAHVTGAQPAAAEAEGWLHGLRLGGTHVPGVLSAGRFYQHGELVFWDVHDPTKAIAIALTDERYTRLVVQVENPTVTLAALARVLKASAAAR